MRVHIIRAAVAAAFLVPGIAPVMADTDKPRLTAEALIGLPGVSSPTISPDGALIAYTVRKTDVAANKTASDLWLIEARERAVPRQVTTGEGAVSSLSWSPDGGFIYFLSRRGSTAQVWRVGVEGGNAEAVTDLPLDIGTYKLSPDGRTIAVTVEVFPDCETLACTVERVAAEKQSKGSGRVYEELFVRNWDTWTSPRMPQLFALPLEDGRASGEAIRLMSGLKGPVPSLPFGGSEEYDFTRDGKSIVFSFRPWNSAQAWSLNFDLYEVPVAGGVPQNLTRGTRVYNTQPVHSPDGRLLAWRATHRPGFEADQFHIVLRDLETGGERLLTEDWDLSVESFAFSPDGAFVYALVDEKGQKPLWALAVADGERTRLTESGAVQSFSAAGDNIVFTATTISEPGEIHVRSIASGNTARLTDHARSEARKLQLGEAEQFSFSGANGDTVYAHMVKPAGFQPGQRYPVLLYLHGGPQQSFGNFWGSRWNFQTAPADDIAALVIDFHGSPGYGQAFTDAVSLNWDMPLEDVLKGLEAAGERYAWLDTDRACAIGGSYGGYLVNWIAGKAPDAFRCLINHAGPFDLRAMAYATDELFMMDWEFGGRAYEDPSVTERFNPVLYVGNWKTPMLVLHGERDYRVPVDQGISAFTAAQRMGVPSRLVVFPDENHWIINPANSIQWQREVEAWLRKWLREPT